MITMNKYAVVENGLVTNVIIAESDFASASGAIACSDGVTIGDKWDGSKFVKADPMPFDRAAAGKAIDKAVIAVYEKPTVLGDEYKLREAGAAAYKAANYTGQVPTLVAGFANAAGMTPKDATDLILAQAAQLRSALEQLGNLRMQKYAVSTAPNDAAAKNVYESTVSNIAAIAAAIG